MSNSTGSFPPAIRHITLSVLALGIAATLIKVFVFSGNTEKDNFKQAFHDHYRIYALPTPENLDFAGEEVPVHLPDVREKIDREMLVNTYWQSQTLLFVKRSSKWFPVIEPILKEEGVPEDLKYLSLIESGFMNVVSPAGATGFWQFMRGAGREYGLEINDEIDERYHVERSTRAACKYLKESHEKYGDWTLAAASYNMGRKGLEKQLNRQQVRNYYDLLLNEETSRYLFRILAVKTILESPRDYGFHVQNEDRYQPIKTRELTIDTAVENFADFAMQQGVSYKTLKWFNPWLRQSYLTNTKKNSYTIVLPASKKGADWWADPETTEWYFSRERSEGSEQKSK